MKNIINTMRFSLFLYFRSPKMVIPILAEALFLFVMYSNTQLPDISEVLAVTAFFTFYIMMWIGNSVFTVRNVRVSEIIRVRIGRFRQDISDCLLISVHALITMIISFMLPFIFSSNKMNFLIMMVSSICIWLCGITGGIVAKFINKFITDRKMTTLILVFIAILTIARKAIVMQLNWLKIILVIMPPIDYVGKCFNMGNSSLDMEKLLIFSLILIVYIIIVGGVSMLESKEYN